MPTTNNNLDNLKGPWTNFHIEVKYRSAPLSELPIVKSSKDAYLLINSIWDTNQIRFQELFIALFFKGGNRFIGWRLISIGDENHVMIDTNLIICLALHTRASTVILAHNHPSGNIEPSDNDIIATEKIKKALQLIDVLLLDHLVISPFKDYLSFADNDIL